jgi:ketosteroid isomerase-like protein
MTEEAAVMATLEDYAAAYCAKDIDRLMGVFDDDKR